MNHDTEFTSSIIASAIAGSDGWNLTLEEGSSLWCPSAECASAPVAGEVATLYGRGFGYAVRGIRIADRVYRYESKNDHEARAKREREEHEKQRAVDTEEMLVREAARADAGEKYAWRDGMGEISGFGGGYEEACRQMVRAGLRWLDEHPEADPIFKGYSGVFGVIKNTNPDAEALSKVVLAACDDCTGAMHQAAIGACLYVRSNGWDAYCEAMSRKEVKS